MIESYDARMFLKEIYWMAYVLYHANQTEKKNRDSVLDFRTVGNIFCLKALKNEKGKKNLSRDMVLRNEVSYGAWLTMIKVGFKTINC